MPGLDGAAATRRILDRFPRTGVLALTMHDDDETLLGALRATARGYPLKSADPDEVVRAVFAVASGDAVYSATVARRRPSSRGLRARKFGWLPITAPRPPGGRRRRRAGLFAAHGSPRTAPPPPRS